MSARRGIGRIAFAGLAIAMLTGVAPVLAAPSVSAADAPAFSGFSTGAVSTPLEVDVYEPTVPIPATPQLELEAGYSKAVADSGGSRARASLLWPGDAVGEGLKVIIDASGLPKQLARDYPLQANSSYPSSRTSDVQEPFPGAVMRTTASATMARAEAGYSGDCEVQDPQAGAAASSRSGGAVDCTVPSATAAVADVAGLASTTQVNSSSRQVVATAHAAAADVSLLGGLLRVTGLSSHVSSLSDGRETKGVAQASYGQLMLGDQTIHLGPDGAAVAGQTVAIPGLPADPNTALALLGIHVTVPLPSYQRQGSLLTSTVSALVVDVDTRVLRHKLDALPWSTVADKINTLPDQLDPVKNILGAAIYLSPRLVFTFAKSQASVNTVQGIAIPPLPTDLGLGVTPGASGLSGAIGGLTAPPVIASGLMPGTSGPGPLVGSMQAAGLPRRYTLPGLLIVAAVVASAFAGTWVRRMSAVLLGGSVLCPHGLDSGLPDLRKV
jgi:hypothetical protein